MTRPSPGDITRILEAVTAGQKRATDELLPLVYAELRRMAQARLRREGPGQTLQPTALVHEVYLRFFRGANPRWENRRHFFSAAAEAMRRILIERARKRARLKRGGELRRVELDSSTGATEPAPEELLALDQALGRLESLDARMAEVVKLRYFGGLTVKETARALDVAPRTVNQDWTGARAWLRREMGRSEPGV
ncbi:MAG: ECF-type sigma factor [Thermoanaerobaculia bacterium]|nr:ECF-type sigma factor [Thermoanaerobaculia bacterium]